MTMALGLLLFAGPAGGMESRMHARPSLSASALARLRSDQLVTVPGFLPPALVDGLLADVARLREAGTLRPVTAAIEHGAVEWFTIWPRPLGESAGNSAREQLYDIVRGLEDSLRADSGYALDTAATELKYACYPFGGHYRRHLDSRVSGEMSREFSIILYLNRNWSPAEGGMLRVFRGSGEESWHEDIAPDAGTLVVFKSDVVPHEVLHTSAKRVSIVGWFNRVRPAVAEVGEGAEEQEEVSELGAALREFYRAKGNAIKLTPGS